jgi:membrane protein DedA with SNARE-associated domain
MISSLVDYVASLPPALFYGFLFVSAYVENVFPPVPGDTVTIFGAYLAGRSHGSFAGVFASTTLGSLGGFLTYYMLGRLIPKDYFVRKNFRFLPASSFETASSFFAKYGYWVILFNRFMSGVRSAISIVCGLLRLPWLKVTVLAAIGGALWNGILIYAGYLAGSNWEVVDRLIQDYSRVMLAVLVIFATVWFVRRRRRKAS